MGMTAATHLAPKVLSMIAAGGITWLLQSSKDEIFSQARGQWGVLDTAQQALITALGNLSCVIVLYSITCFIVMTDLMEGRYYEKAQTLATSSSQNNSLASVVECSEEDADNVAASSSDSPVSEQPPTQVSHIPTFVVGTQTWIWRLRTFFEIFNDTALVGYCTMFFYAVVPVLMAAWSLFRRGTDFEYIVALKPDGQF